MVDRQKQGRHTPYVVRRLSGLPGEGMPNVYPTQKPSES
jgi:hypothetical protein